MSFYGDPDQSDVIDLRWIALLQKEFPWPAYELRLVLRDMDSALAVYCSDRGGDGARAIYNLPAEPVEVSEVVKRLKDRQ